MTSLGLWPSTFGVRSCRFMPITNQRVNAAPGGGSEQVVDMLNDRWICYVTLRAGYFPAGAALEAFLASFRGQVNTVDLWHFARPTPNGTISGSPTLAANASQGASSISIQTLAGATVKAGDMVGAGGLLLMSAADATADGSGVLVFSMTNRLRKALTSGAAVTINKPTAPFRLLAHNGVEFAQGVTNEPELTLGEAI